MVFRNLSGLIVAVALSGCAGYPGWSLQLFPKTDQMLAAGHYSFAWRLSGDRQVGPIQVFDDGKATWVHFASDQAIPAIFGRTIEGDIPLPYEADGTYIVLKGVWPVLVFRNGHSQALAERLPDEDNGAAAAVVALPKVEGHLSGDASQPQPGAALVSSVPAVHTPASSGQAGAATPLASDSGPMLAPVLQEAHPLTTQESALAAAALTIPGLESQVPEGPPILIEVLAERNKASTGLQEAEKTGLVNHFRVSRDDKNMRLALARWASKAGWTFLPEHWAVDVDIPIVGEAGFNAVFEEAVQELLGATEMAERPLQPCFYSNRVLRIVPYAQVCDRTAGQEPT